MLNKTNNQFVGLPFNVPEDLDDYKFTTYLESIAMRLHLHGCRNLNRRVLVLGFRIEALVLCVLLRVSPSSVTGSGR